MAKKVPQANENLKQGMRYISNGFLSFLIANIVFQVVLRLSPESINYTLVFVISSVIVLPISFQLQRKIVWKSEFNYLKEFTRFAVVSVPNLLITWILVIRAQSLTALPLALLQPIVSVVVLISNFFIHKFWTFSGK